MLSRFREPGGKFSLIAAGVALLILAGFLLMVPLGGVNLLLSAGVGGAGAVCLWRTWSRERADRYDLKRLFDSPVPDPEEPLLDHVPEDEVGAPYCGWCDEAYAPGTRRCRACGRDLG